MPQKNIICLGTVEQAEETYNELVRRLIAEGWISPTKKTLKPFKVFYRKMNGQLDLMATLLDADVETVSDSERMEVIYTEDVGYIISLPECASGFRLDQFAVELAKAGWLDAKGNMVKSFDIKYWVSGSVVTWVATLKTKNNRGDV